MSKIGSQDPGAVSFGTPAASVAPAFNAVPATRPPAADSMSLSAASRARLVAVAAPTDPAFEAGYQLIKDRFAADTVDPREVFAGQLQKQKTGRFGKDAYRFLALEGAAGNRAAAGPAPVVAVATSNYFHRSNVVFENYFVAKDGLESNKALLSALVGAGRKDAAAAGHQLAGVVVEADPKEVPLKHDLGYRKLAGVAYVQPPLAPGGKPVPLPLMLDAVNADDPGFVKRDGQVVAITADKARQIITDLYRNVYDKQSAGGPLPSKTYLPRILHSFDGKTTIPLE